jgi:cytidyltransferase-like protein
MKTVAIAGGFDPFHEGHLEHIRAASRLGDYLYVFVSNDDDMIKKKGKANIPLGYRIQILHDILIGERINGMVLPTSDIDGTQAKTLEQFKPNIFAKGKDRNKGNMPISEINICRQIGCKIVYNVGIVLNSSSNMKLIGV